MQKLYFDNPQASLEQFKEHIQINDVLRLDENAC